MMVRRGCCSSEATDLDRVQALFPHDNLRLRDRDPFTPRKGLVRSKSSAALRIQKALPSKTKTLVDGEEVQLTGLRRQSGDYPERSFIMEGPVRFSMGVQSHERYLFLFNDLLLIGKPRSGGGSYKLKEKVLVCELWLASCIEEVCETSLSHDTSFVVGWPTTNVVATFSSPALKESWETKLQQLINEAKEREGTKVTTALQILVNNNNLIKLIKVNNKHTARDCIKTLIEHTENNNGDPSHYQLWVKVTGGSNSKEESPYPLIGHEFPFCIKMNYIRNLLPHKDLDLPFEELSAEPSIKCNFTLRRNFQKVTFICNLKGPSNSPLSSKTPTRSASKKSSPRKLIWPLFRRHKQDSVDSGHSSPPPSKLFGQPLSSICHDGQLPQPILNILQELFRKGPFTVGIFRKSANARACRELKMRLETQPDYSLQEVAVLVLASVLKEFLRNLPGCLLLNRLYPDWLKAVNAPTDWECRQNVLRLVNSLPPENLELLRHLVCLLWHIAARAEENKMTSGNLAVCIGPSVLAATSSLQQSTSAIEQTQELSEQVPKVVTYLIDHCQEIFGEECLHLLGACSPPAERDAASSRQDSGAEESDSLQGGYRRDDSSIDSLERDFIDVEPSKFPFESKMSLTNLSRDSGLTLSDTQLYAPEDEVDGDPSGEILRNRIATLTLAKSAPHLEVAGLESLPLRAVVGSVSIDGSCHDVVRKRKTQEFTPKRSPAHQTPPSSLPENKYIHYEETPSSHYSLNYSLSYNYNGGPATPSEVNKVPNSSVKRRLCRGRTCHPEPLMSVSVIEPPTERQTTVLRRSASEESLLHKYGDIQPTRKRRAPSPPRQKANNSVTWRSTSHLSATPDRHALWFAHQNRTVNEWKRSQSVSKIDEPSYNSSTLSLECSDESTPHVSRSNSRVQELMTDHKASLMRGQSSPRISSVCSSSSDTSLRSQLSRSSKASSHCSTGSERNKPPSPPSYQEAMCRKTLLHRLNTSPLVTDEMRQHQTQISAKARQLYESSLKKYNEQAEQSTHRAVLVKIEPCNHHSNLQRTTSEVSRRLRQLPPVHVRDSQLPPARNKVISPPRALRDELREDWRKEISWSVAHLRTFFISEQTNSPNESKPSSTKVPSLHHKRSDSLDSRTSAEESFV